MIDGFVVGVGDKVFAERTLSDGEVEELLRIAQHAKSRWPGKLQARGSEVVSRGAAGDLLVAQCADYQAVSGREKSSDAMRDADYFAAVSPAVLAALLVEVLGRRRNALQADPQA